MGEVRKALLGSEKFAAKEKGPPVADGVLSVTPDPPEMAEWRAKSVLDSMGAGSTFLDDEPGAERAQGRSGRRSAPSALLSRELAS